MSVFLVQYILLLVLLPICKQKFRFAGKIVEGDKVALFIFLLFSGALLGLRGISVGTDTKGYWIIREKIQTASGFGDAMTRSTLSAPVYVGVSYVLLKLGLNIQALMILDAIVIMSGLYIFIKKYCYNIPVCCFLFLGLTLYYEFLNGTRQGIAVAILLCAICLLDDNFFSIRGWFLFLISVGVHTTAIVGIAIIFALYFAKKVKSPQILCLGSIGICVVGILAVVVGLKLFVRIFPQYEMYVNGENAVSILHGDGAGRIGLVYFAIAAFCFATFVMCWLKKIKAEEIEYRFLAMVIIMSFVGVVFAKNVLIMRMLWYFLPVAMVFIANTLCKAQEENRYVMLIASVLAFGGYGMIHLLEDKSCIIPYMFFWNM